jgi:hypothetical protein
LRSCFGRSGSNRWSIPHTLEAWLARPSSRSLGVAVVGDELWDHACNVFCSPPVHCELVLSRARDVITATLSEHRLARERWAAEIGEAYARRCGVEIVRVLPRVDAPGDADPRLRMSLLGGSTDQERWLVWWRKKEDADNSRARHHADTER